MNTRLWPESLDAEFNRMMAEEARREAIERAQEMARENVYDDGQETDHSPLDDDETVTDYRNRRGE